MVGGWYLPTCLERREALCTEHTHLYDPCRNSRTVLQRRCRGVVRGKCAHSSGLLPSRNLGSSLLVTFLSSKREGEDFTAPRIHYRNCTGSSSTSRTLSFWLHNRYWSPLRKLKREVSAVLIYNGDTTYSWCSTHRPQTPLLPVSRISRFS